MEEVEAIGWYEQRIAVEPDPEVRVIDLFVGSKPVWDLCSASVATDAPATEA
jgi:hypothetical protein